MSANSQLVSIKSRPTFNSFATECGNTLSTISGTIILTLLAVAITQLSNFAADCQLDRGMQQGGSWWQILTCHFTHWNSDHLFWDATVFVGLGAICERRHRFSWAVCVVGSAIMIPIAILTLCPEMETYRGLSGIDSAIFALFVARSLTDAYKQKDRTSVLIYSTVIAGFTAKLTFETATGSTFFVDSSAAGFVPIVEAHVVGAILGALVFLAVPEKLCFSRAINSPGERTALDGKC